MDETNKYIKTLESMNENEIIHSNLIRPTAKLLVPKNKNQFRLVDDPDSENWNDFLMNGEKVSLYDNKPIFRDTGVVLTLKGDILSSVTDYNFIKPELPDAKHFLNFLDEMHFKTRAKGKSNRDKNLIKKLL